MKQKSLMSFFGKTPTKDEKTAATPNLKATSAKEKAPDADASSPVVTEARTPLPKGSSQSSGIVSATYTRSSEGSARDTPPTSDPIDVDMIEDEDEDESGAVQSSAARPTASRTKRKIVVDDDDDDLASSEPLAYKRASGRSKKARMSAVFSDEEEEEEEDAPRLNSFAKRLTKYQKSPAKGKSRRRKTDDDDDFIVPDDINEEDEDEDNDRASSRASSSSRPSSRLSAYSRSSGATDAESDEEAPKTKKKAAARPPLQKESSSMGGSNFLTAAEQRALKQKDEKKSTEDPFSFLVDVRDKDEVRPGQPGYDPRTLYIPPRAWTSFTPFEKQFWEIKQNHFDTILFFQKGKFLELYEEDARVGHREFDLKLTQRVKMSMVGVPEMSFNFWAAKFLAKGYKVGRVDQAETALGAEMRLAADKKNKKEPAKDKGKDKIVRRELNKVYTNGTLVDEELLTDEQAGHCVSIREEEAVETDKDGKQTFGICVLDSATSEFNLSAFEDDICRTKLETMMRQLRPKEIIFTKGNLSVSTTRLLKSILPGNCLWTSLRESEGFKYNEAIKELKKLYPADEDDDEMADNPHGLTKAVPEPIRRMLPHQGAIQALGSMIWYLHTLNIDKDILSMKNFNVYDPMKRGQGLVLDGQTLAHVEVLQNNEGTEEGTLLKLLGRCITPSGKRLFRIWLCMPLREVKDINARLDAVQDLLEHPTFEKDFTAIAKGLPDLERIVSRIHAKNCKVKDFIKVLGAFRSLSKGLSALAETADSFDSKSIPGLLRTAPDLTPNLKHIQAMFKPPESGSDELCPEDGKDEVYDGIMEEINELENELKSELKKLRKQTGLDLTYWHSAQGTKEIYLVQTQGKERDKAPKGWTLSGSTKAAKRFIVPALQTTIRKVKEARENRNTAIKEFKNRLYAEFDLDRSVWLRAIRVLAELDCLFSLAKASSALGEPACRPELVEGDEAFIEFEDLRHPALCASGSLKGDFIPNNVKLGGEVGKIALLTGTGKSTAMRMTAAGIIMAQLGMLVPAAKARLCPVDSILTRMGAYDNMFSNASTFKVELDECCKILRDATPKSFVILDELGRGTSTYDGMAIAAAVLHELATHTLSLSFFATHYGSLTDDFAYHPNIRNMHMQTLVDDEKRELVFLYKLVEGVASSSFGTHVANLAGVPLAVVERAEVVSRDFAKHFQEKVEGKKNKAAGRLPIVAQADFAYLYKLATGALEMPADRVRRREVLRMLKGAVKGCLQECAA
ncbi:DNA mismatch repair protein Msh6 [Trametes versicolor FP-101664 SS1]|uniref:DNA mismatch repair protein Msh6 n=1 Tax=Trametes versicolor (strain FP-101664) TaxID=717944 RepID=UPI000462475E|nr:DNA mismatch repair protein Msh6 [Trametes versicolor FP-101664 SS1]EIW55250.1 DNA mismatch repair protein Msh6 [Trametes versicolor FP-101664 SS1]